MKLPDRKCTLFMMDIPAFNMEEDGPLRSMYQRFTHIFVLPYLVVLPGVLSILISYLWALYNRDVPAFLPYISDAGGDPPQSAIFGLGITITACSALACFLVRHLMVADINKDRRVYITALNHLVLLSGVATCFGLIVVSVNPTGHLRRDGSWYKPVYIPHLVGAGVVFTSGVFNMFMNTVLTYLLCPRYQPPFLVYARLICTIVAFVSFTVTSATWPFDNIMVMKPQSGQPRQYPDGALISTVSEWIMTGTFMVYMFLFKFDLNGVTLVVGIDRPQSFDIRRESTPAIAVQQP